MCAGFFKLVRNVHRDNRFIFDEKDFMPCK